MITQETIEEITRRLVGIYDPLEIYLFGSYVWGSPEKSSDLDLLVVVKESNEKSYKRSIPGSCVLIDLMVPNDILVYTEEEFKKRANDCTTLCHKVLTEGRILYAKS